MNEQKTKYMIMSKSEIRRAPQTLTIGENKFEGVSCFRYLGAMVFNDNDLSREIKNEIQAGNRAYFANRMIFKNRLITRNTKVKIYKTLVRPVVTFGSETWTMKRSDEDALRVFERRILRKIYGPIKENGDWRIRYNSELEHLIGGQDIVRFIKARRIGWLGHVERMTEERMPRRILNEKFYHSRRKGRPRLRWIDEVTANLQSMNIKDWKRKAKDQREWRRIVEEAKAHQGL